MNLSELIEQAREQFRAVLDDEEFLSDPGDVIHGIVDPLTPTDTATLATIIREEPEIAFAEPELAEPGASPARVITIAVFERLEQELWEMYRDAREGQPDRWRIRREGCGSFLNPPGHPEHHLSLVTEGGFTSLSYVVEHPDQFPSPAVAACQRELDKFDAGEPDEKWVSQVLGYFGNCYRPQNGSSNVSDFIIPNNTSISGRAELDGLVVSEEECDTKGRYHVDPMRNIDRHAGVAYIRRFYPDWTPTKDNFKGARWGNA